MGQVQVAGVAGGSDPVTQLVSDTRQVNITLHTMKTSIIKRLSLKIKTFVARLRRDKYFVNVDEENDYNEATEDIINDNLHNERLEAALAQLVARSPACHEVTRMTFVTEAGLSVSFYSGCQAAGAQTA